MKLLYFGDIVGEQGDDLYDPFAFADRKIRAGFRNGKR